MEQMLEEQDLLLNHNLSLYHCNLCQNDAIHPVLPPCGHLFCWKCVHETRQCPCCGGQFNEDLFALFVDHGQLEAEGLPLPPKPKPRYAPRIRNSGGIQNDLVGGMKFRDNLTRKAQLAGFGMIPPLSITSFSSYPDQQEEELVFSKFPLKYTWVAFVIFLLVVVWLS